MEELIGQTITQVIAEGVDDAANYWRIILYLSGGKRLRCEAYWTDGEMSLETREEWSERKENFQKLRVDNPEDIWHTDSLSKDVGGDD